MFTPDNSAVVKRLIDLGVIPRECRRFELILEVGSPATARFEVMVSEEDLQKIADALVDNPTEVTGLVKQAIVTGRISGRTVKVEYD